MGTIIGTKEFVLRQDIYFNARGHMYGFLRYALTVDTSIRSVMVRRGIGDYDLGDRVVSRLEAIIAWSLLPEKCKWAIWDRVVMERPVWEVAIAHKCHARTIQRRVQYGVNVIYKQIYEADAIEVLRENAIARRELEEMDAVRGNGHRKGPRGDDVR